MQIGGLEYLLAEEELPRRELPSNRYYMHSSGMPHRSGEVGEPGRHDGSYISAQEMAELERSGDLERLIRRIQEARAALGN
jgi:hypothetical protein